MKLSSPAFADAQSMPSRYAADGDNHSPPLVFEEVTSEAKSLALTFEEEPNSDHSSFVHWVMFDIDPKISGLALAEIVGRYRDGVNGFRELGYTGPHDREQRAYVFRLYALDTRLGLANGVDVRQVRQAMAGHVLETSDLHCVYRCTNPLPSAPLDRIKAPVAQG